MKIVQGFVSIPSLSDNSVNAIAEFGEFSPHSATFTKDLRSYSDTDVYPHIEIITVKVIDEASTEIALPTAVSDKMLAVSNWIYTQYSNSAIPLNMNKATMEQAILAEFSGVSRVQIGQILPTADPSKRLLDHVRFDVNHANVQWRVTLWWSDSRFRSQYRYYDIHVVPPIDDVSRLIGKIADVAVALNAVKTQAITNRINTHNAKHKLSHIHTLDVDWHDPNNAASRLLTGWTLLIHGNAGSDTEAMKSAIREYLEEQVPGAQWAKIFPSLYSANEFILIPYWKDYASVLQNYDDGLYRSMVSLGGINDIKEKFVPSTYKYGSSSEQFLNKNGTIMSVFYRSMMVYTIGNPANNGDVFSILELYPDYMSVSTESLDFARMSMRTQNFVLKLNDCMNKARVYDPNVGTPEGYTLSLRGAREYLGFDYEGYTYYILTRHGHLREV